MSMQIELRHEYCEEILTGKSIVTEDKSIIFEPAPPISSFSIHLYDWSFELTTRQVSENKYLICYALASFCFSKCKCANLNIPSAQKGKLFIYLDFPHADGVYYSDCVPFVRERFYDHNNKIFAIGDIAASGKSIEFADGQIAVIDETGRLTAVYINLGLY